MTIYLYVKTHRKTGLKYLGKTERKDPHKYRGSGDYWKDHLRIHGNDVDTQILRECQTIEELREWGLYYSRLWNVVEERDEHGKKTWANMIEEAGDGFTSEQSGRMSRQRVKNGTHNWLGGEQQRQRAKKRIDEGTHPFLDGEISRRTQQKRVTDGTHHLLGGEIQRRLVAEDTHNLLGGKINRQRVKDGTHNWLGGKQQTEQNLKRVADGTHPFLGNGDLQRQVQQKRIEEGTHHFLSGDIQRRAMLNRVADGTHNSLQPWTCEHCGKSGKGVGGFVRWHKDGVCLIRCSKK